MRGGLPLEAAAAAVGCDFTVVPGGVFFARAVQQWLRLRGCFWHYVLQAARESGQVAPVAVWFWPVTTSSSWSVKVL
jgi:hypothetical protein